MNEVYASRKPSGIPWIDDLPVHWEVQPLLAVAQERDEANEGMKEKNLLSLSYGRIVRKDINSNDGLLPGSFETYQIVEPGDVVLRLTDLQNDQRSLRSGLVRERGIITSAYAAVAPLGIAPEYLNHLLRAYDLAKVFYSMGGGLRQSMKYSDMRRLPIVVPPLPEQTAIAAFLDRETGKIDALVAEQRRLIELLNEKRQVVISHAVTKGLDPNAKLKPSGVEWLGDVPESWEVTQLKRLIHVLSGYAFPSERFSRDAVGTRLLRGVNVAVGSIRWEEVVYWERSDGDGLAPFELREGDIVLGMDRPWIGEGLRVARLHGTDVPSLLLQRVAALRPSASLLPGYVMRLLQGEAFFHHCVPEMTGVSVPHISPAQVGSFLVAVPPLDEQIHTERHLAAETTKIDGLILAAEAAIGLLQERRSALISAGVTGKIDVREAAAAETVAA